MVRTVLCIQNVSVVCVALGLALCLSLSPENDDTPSWRFFAALVLTDLFGAIAQISSAVADNAVTRDWLPSVASPDLLLAVTSVNRVLDLTTAALAPLLSAVVIELLGGVTSAYVLAVYNLVSLVPEMAALSVGFANFPLLAEPAGAPNRELSDIAPAERSEDSEDAPALTPVASPGPLWPRFLRSPFLPPAAAMSLLYFTVLSPSTQPTVAFLVANGTPVSVVGVASAASAVTGILGAYIAPRVIQRRKSSVNGTANAFLAVFGLVVTVAAACTLFIGSGDGALNWATIAFLALTASSRVALWGFDVLHSSIFQLTVPAPDRSGFGGCQKAMNASGSFLLLLLVLCLNATSRYPIAAIVSAAATLTSVGIFSRWSRSLRAPLTTLPSSPPA
jgi:hypothetical protein